MVAAAVWRGVRSIFQVFSKPGGGGAATPDGGDKASDTEAGAMEAGVDPRGSTSSVESRRGKPKTRRRWLTGPWCRKRRSPLLERASVLPDPEPYPQLFPMYVVPMAELLKMTKIEPHQDLKARGALKVYTPDMGPALFISHQWCSFHHPDPNFEQFKVFLAAVECLANGSATVLPDAFGKVVGGVKKYTRKELTEKLRKAFVWYDYFAVPQIKARDAESVVPEDVARAVASFPAYVQACELFVVLAPAVVHANLGDVALSFASWKRRGWCRVERAARALADGDTQMLLVTAPTVWRICPPADYLLTFPSTAEFTVETDRALVVPIMEQMLDRKLTSLLKAKNLPKYRQLLAMRDFACGIEREARQASQRLPSFMRMSTCDVAQPTVQTFLDLYGLCDVRETDADGCTSLMYAAMAGNVAVVCELIDSGVDIHAITHRKSSLHGWCGKGFTALHWAAMAPGQLSAATVKTLVDKHANVETMDKGTGFRPIHMAAVCGRIPAVEALLEAGASIEGRTHLRSTPLMTGGIFGHAQVVMCLLENRASPTETTVLAATALHNCVEMSGDAIIARQLVIAKCPVDATCVSLSAAAAQTTNRKVGTALNVLAWSFKLASVVSSSPEVVSWNNFEGRTALMMATINGRQDVARVLLDCGADPSLKSSNGFNAAEWGRLFRQPETFVKELSSFENLVFI